ncbi:MAG: HAMP domain-containing sensor histidine kinase [Peptostreptococcaceae bacterium]|nr:HAMP domain-containing sensor histidine kinase [Peptostreptococcaceae bacterium]
MSRIGKKLILSYLVIVSFTIFILMSIIKVDFENNLNERIFEDLKNDAINISRQIEEDREVFQSLGKYEEGGSVRDIFPSDAAFKYSVRFASTNIFILNQDQQPVYASWKDDTNLMDFINSPESQSKYFKYQSSINNSSGEIIGYVLTLAKKEDTSNINAMVNEAAATGMAISLTVAVLLSFVFENNITSPIKKLGKNIQNFKIAEETKWEQINSNDEISDLNEDFRNMTVDLVKYDRQQKEFFQNSSHELKTPLMSIRSYAEAIKDGIVNDDEVDRFLDIIIDESNKLTEIVNSIMYMTKLDADHHKKVQIKDIDLDEIVEEIVTRFTAVATEKDLQIIRTIDPSIKLRLREDHTFMILSNLIANSLRYAGSSIYIDGYYEGKDRDKKIIIEVYDDGEGFDAKEIPRVFDRFFKGEKGLSGLGLSIVKGIVESNDGKVIAFNKEGYGACIKIIFQIK